MYMIQCIQSCFKRAFMLNCICTCTILKHSPVMTWTWEICYRFAWKGFLFNQTRVDSFLKDCYRFGHTMKRKSKACSPPPPPPKKKRLIVQWKCLSLGELLHLWWNVDFVDIVFSALYDFIHFSASYGHNFNHLNQLKLLFILSWGGCDYY